MKKPVAVNSKRTAPPAGSKSRPGLLQRLKIKVTEKLKIFREEDPKIYPHF